MKYTLLVVISIFIFSETYAQYVHKIKADSVFITNDSCNAELILENATRDTLGFLYNKGNGRTEFRKAVLKLSDSVWLIGSDTLKINFSSFKPGGSHGAIQFNKNGSFGGDASKFYWDTLNKRVHIGGNTPESDLTITASSLGSTYAETDGISLLNKTAATSTVSQRSPGIRFVGQGWKTDSPAGSQQVEVNNYMLPVTGATNPTYKLIWEEQRNNGTRYPIMILGFTGLQVMGYGGASGGLSFSNQVAMSNSIVGTNILTFRLGSVPDSNTFNFNTAYGFAQTSGNTRFLRISNSTTGFNPSSGTATHSLLVLEPKIDQTGSASGITRGIYIHPTLTSAVDFRAIEVDTGRSLLRSIYLTHPGDKINIATGTNASLGTATLSSGTITVNTTAVTSSSKILLTYNTPSGTTGQISAPASGITAGTSFTINSSSASDNSTVNWWIIN